MKFLLLAIAIIVALVAAEQIKEDYNAISSPLQMCAPGAGITGDGFCRFDRHDVHQRLVCAVETKAYLDFLRTHGGHDQHIELHGDAGEHQQGRRLCVSALEWKRAVDEGKHHAPDAILAATHENTLKLIPHTSLFKLNPQWFIDPEDREAIDPASELKPKYPLHICYNDCHLR
jgi:uncharacterized protein (DUF2237 family)